MFAKSTSIIFYELVSISSNNNNNNNASKIKLKVQQIGPNWLISLLATYFYFSVNIQNI